VYTMNIRVETAQNLANFTVPADVDAIIVSYPAEYVEDDPNDGYTYDTKALISAIDMHFLDFEFTGSAGVEEDGKGEWAKMVRKPVSVEQAFRIAAEHIRSIVPVHIEVSPHPTARPISLVIGGRMVRATYWRGQGSAIIKAAKKAGLELDNNESIKQGPCPTLAFRLA